MIRRGLSILLTLALVLALALSAGAAGTPTVRIETPENVKARESFEVRVVIENNPGLSAIQFTVSYDQKSLRCDKCSTGSILSGTLSATNASGEDGAVLAAAPDAPNFGIKTRFNMNFKTTTPTVPQTVYLYMFFKKSILLKSCSAIYPAVHKL